MVLNIRKYQQAANGFVTLTTTVETSYSDHIWQGQIDHYKRKIIITEFLKKKKISHADYHLIDICIFITWL